MNDNLIQVLWVEDDPEITRVYPMEAVRYGLELIPFSCWEEAEIALESDFKRWSAIILDAKCKYKKNDLDNASRFLTHALNSITKTCTEKHRQIPWFVLSGGSEEELNDLIIDDRDEWDDDWTQKKYYSKISDRDILFHRIPHKVRLSPEMQIRLFYYPDVFKAITRCKLATEVEIRLEDLLKPMHFFNLSDKDENYMMTSIRKCIEDIFHSMAHHAILPCKESEGKRIIHDLLVDCRGSINNTYCSKILSGIDVTCGETIIIKSENILPNVLKDSFKRLIEIVGAYEHAKNKDASPEQRKNSRHTAEFLESIGNSPYLLRSMVMELCCIIQWYSNYIAEHSNENDNKKRWNIESNNHKLSE